MPADLSTLEGPIAREPAASAMPPVPWLVKATRAETRDTFTFELEPADGAVRYSFRPGQFNMLWAFGAGEVPISMSGPPGETRTLIHTIRAVGNVTQVLRQLRKGATLGVRGPFGEPWPVDLAEGHDIVLMAGGIGLAPLRPVLYHLLAHRSRYGRVALLVGARTPDDLLFQRELESWRGRFDVEVAVTVDRTGPGWFGNVGVVTRLLDRIHFDPADTTAFLCGPEVMMRFGGADLIRAGVPEARIWMSLERNMKCGIGLCGHCQLGPVLVCRDGPVFRWDRAAALLAVREL
jgi:NAD(P)H-flavin reductase